MTPVVVGVDPSLAATGIALSDGSLITVGGKADRGDERLLDLACAIGSACHNADLLVIEDLPKHAQAAGLVGMAQGVVRLMAMRAGVPYALVPPATLKKFATGKGNATKPDMRMELYKQSGLDVRDDNQVDAAWLRLAGLVWFSPAVIYRTVAELKALEVVKWPELPVRGAA